MAARPSSSGPAAGSEKGQKDDRVLYQTRVSSFVKDSMDLTAQAVLAADRRRCASRSHRSTCPRTNKTPTAPVISNPLCRVLRNLKHSPQRTQRAARGKN